MNATTIIVGNGLGMAINPDYFKLESGLNMAKNKFTKDQINVIKLNKDEMPKTEYELESHHKILSACSELIKHNHDIKWLTKDGEEFPNLYQHYIYKVAKYFYDYSFENDSPEKFDSFVLKLVKYIKNNNLCHIATLNYDRLLYQALIKHKILYGYQDGGLVDGFNNNGGFYSENLIRSFHNFGWYLHIHGSPLFKTDENGNLLKCKIGNIPGNFSENNLRHNHIVLASTKLKPAVIANSKLLDCYFDFFIEALSESNKIILFGYSGNDEHINLAIKRTMSDNLSSKSVEVIEWNGNSTMNQSERESYWKDRLGLIDKSNLKLELYSNILNYEFNVT